MSESEVYLVRHAIAEERGDQWPDDDLRPLTPEGIDRFTLGVQGLLTLEKPPDQVFTSPLVRARQTAELLAQGANPSPPVTVMEELAPGHSPSSVLTQVRKRGDLSRVALVGHEPDLGYLAAYLLGTSEAMPFKKGGICRVDVDWSRRPKGTLVWFLTPKALRKLGGAGDGE